MQSIYKPVDVACAFAVPRIPVVDWSVFRSWFLQNSRSNENISELVSLQGSVVQRSLVSILLTMLQIEIDRITTPWANHKAGMLLQI